MSNYKFEDGEYLVVLSDDTDVFDCHSCNSMDEVYEVLSNRIMDELEYLFHQDMSYEDALENGIWRPEDVDFAEELWNTRLIKDMSVIRDAYDTFFADGWSYLVMNSYGDVEASRRSYNGRMRTLY